MSQINAGQTIVVTGGVDYVLSAFRTFDPKEEMKRFLEETGSRNGFNWGIQAEFIEWLIEKSIVEKYDETKQTTLFLGDLGKLDCE